MRWGIAVVWDLRLLKKTTNVSIWYRHTTSPAVQVTALLTWKGKVWDLPKYEKHRTPLHLDESVLCTQLRNNIQNSFTLSRWRYKKTIWTKCTVCSKGKKISAKKIPRTYSSSLICIRKESERKRNLNTKTQCRLLHWKLHAITHVRLSLL